MMMIFYVYAVGQTTAPPLLLLHLLCNNCFSMSNFYWQLSDILIDIHILYFIVFFLMNMFVLATMLLSHSYILFYVGTIIK